MSLLRRRRFIGINPLRLLQRCSRNDHVPVVLPNDVCRCKVLLALRR